MCESDTATLFKFNLDDVVRLKFTNSVMGSPMLVMGRFVYESNALVNGILTTVHDVLYRVRRSDGTLQDFMECELEADTDAF